MRKKIKAARDTVRTDRQADRQTSRQADSHAIVKMYN